jgi:geranylgeranyl transferase type-2 subunit alpha
MTLLRDLHELEPDAKWPMESLVHYSLLLLAQPAADRRDEMRNEVGAWLQRLEEVDPARQERWRDLVRKLD